MSAGLRVSMHFRAVIVLLFAVAVTIGDAQTPGYFTPTDSMTGAPDSSATAQLDGDAILFAGRDAHDGRSEVYNPADGRFVQAAALNVPRAGAAAIRLADGRVLVVGGARESTAVRTAEFYEPSSGTFTAAGELVVARVRPAVARLRDGRVLIAGGHDGAAALESAELYDPGTGTFALTGSMSMGRVASATLLNNGTVLMTGGDPASATASVEVFDPAIGSFRATGSLNVARRGHSATTLSDGRVLVSGGLDDKGSPLDTAEVYDPATGSFGLVGTMRQARYDHTAVLLIDGAVFVVGGRDSAGPLGTTERYDSTSGTFSADATMLEPRVAPVLAALSDGGALVAGGRGSQSEPLSTAERYWREDRRQDTWTTVASNAPSSTYGQPVTYTAIVGSGGKGSASGAVRFFDGGTLLGEARLESGRAALTTSATPAGTRAITAAYQGGAEFKASDSQAIQQFVAKAAATGSFTITPIQRQYSDVVTFVATVSPATAAQSVTFRLGTTVLGTAPVTAGKATVSGPVLPNMPPGSRIITAVFNQEMPNYTIANVSKSMSIVKEDARVIQHGYGATVYTACATCSQATVLLRATVKDISATSEANGDVTPGDIRNATFTFINRSTYATIATVPVRALDDTNPITGEALYQWTVDLGSSSSKSFRIGYSVSGLYTRGSYDYVTITVSKPRP